MLVKYVAVPVKRTPKKVEVTLSRVTPVRKNVIKLNARVADIPADEITAAEEIAVVDETAATASEDNLDGIVPVYEFVAEDDYSDSEDSPEEESTVSAADVDADFEELENDLISQISDLEKADSDEDSVSDTELPGDDSIIQRHFVRNDTGELFESDNESAEGHEVACYDNTGKLKRACGVIRKGSSPLTSPADDNDEDDDDGFSQAVSDMFSFSND